MSRTIYKEVYSFNELSESAKKEALSELSYNLNYPWTKEYVDFHMDYTYREEIFELSGIRLMKYIYNNYFNNIYAKKYYSKSRWFGIF